MEFKIKELFFDGNQREIVIVSTVYIEDLLEKLLVKYCIQEDKKTLFENNGPANTLGNKVLICYSFGLISSNIYEILEILRKIRNKCAHGFDEKSKFKINLSDNNFQNILKNLFPLKNKNTSEKKAIEKTKKLINESTSILLYLYLVLAVSDCIESTIKKTNTIEKPRKFILKNIEKYFTFNDLRKIFEKYNINLSSYGVK